MIQIIGLMMAAYIAFHGLDSLTDDTKPWVVKVSAIVLIIIAIGGVVLLLATDASVSDSLPKPSF